MEYLMSDATVEGFADDLFTITFPGGAQKFTTSSQLPLVWNGQTYQSSAFGMWSKGQITTEIGTGSNDCQITINDNQQSSFTGPVTFSGAQGINGLVHIQIDTPGASNFGLAIGTNAPLVGWAIAGPTNTVASVALYVDGTLVGNATYGAARPDVAAAFPGQAGSPDLGWTATLNTNNLTQGPAHVLGAVATDSVGNVATSTAIFYVGENLGVPLMSAMALGLFDGALITIQTAYMPINDYGHIIGVETKFAGIMGEISQLGRTSCAFTAHDMMYVLNLQMPRNLMSSGCRHALFDAGCTLSKAAHQQNRNCASGSGGLTITLNVPLPAAAPYYQQGFVTFSSGQNVGITRSIRTQVSTSQLMLSGLFPFAIGVGDAVEIFPGCDKTMSTCSSRFGNLIHFSGYSFIPAPETVL